MNEINLESYCKCIFKLELSIFTAGSVISKLEKKYTTYQMVEPSKINESEPKKPIKPINESYPEEPEKPNYKNILTKKKDEREYLDKKSKYDETCKKIEKKNNECNNAYQSELNKYNAYYDLLKKNKVEADTKTNFNLRVAKPIILSKIKLMKKSMEKSRKTVDTLYRFKTLDVRYRGLISSFVFCNYLISGRYNSLDGNDGIIAAYEVDYNNNLIPMDNDIPNVKQTKQEVTELIDDLNNVLVNLENSNLDDLKNINPDIRFKINSYVEKLNADAENIAREYNLFRGD